jgi:FixJ family two-component response regulator
MTGLIYIVDDEPPLRKSLAGLLADAGFKVKECSSAESFLQLEPRYEPSCILLDVTMDGMSGLELQEQLSEREFVPPIVFLTGRANLQQAVSALRAGACHFLTKPVNDEQLLETVTEAIEQSSSEALFFRFLKKLTKTEQKIAKLIRQGLQTKQIAAELDASERTIEWHRKNIGKKGYIPK